MTSHDIARQISHQLQREVIDPPAQYIRNTLIILLLITVLSIMLLFWPCSARAETPINLIVPPQIGQKFLILTAYAAIDYEQSRCVAPGKGCTEINPVLGVHPTKEKMLLYGAVGMSIAYLLSMLLSEAHFDFIITSALTSEQYNIESNAQKAKGQGLKSNTMPIIFTWKW